MLNPKFNPEQTDDTGNPMDNPNEQTLTWLEWFDATLFSIENYTGAIEDAIGKDYLKTIELINSYVYSGFCKTLDIAGSDLMGYCAEDASAEAT